MNLKKRYLPKILLPLVQFIFGLGFLTLFIYGIIKFSIDFKIELLIQAIFFLSFIGFIAFHLIYNFLFYLKNISFQENGFAIFEYHKLKTSKVDYNEISGFSNSEVYFGKYTWKSKSLVVYTKSNGVFEILNNYNSSNDKFELELKKHKIKYYGFEEYSTGWYFREYRFSEKLKTTANNTYK
ncbi:MAG: hypothetical protein HRT69_18630 [Flavobacteriaceae bacterium]|nr:hypothetical protein [Flavobacteriaceae bacterium]